MFYATCPKHGCKGRIQVKYYVEHWHPLKKAPVLCYLRRKDLPELAQKLFLPYGHRRREND
jgi:hypothetical protein